MIDIYRQRLLIYVVVSYDQNVAVILEAASSGVSLQADRRAKVKLRNFFFRSTGTFENVWFVNEVAASIA